MTQSTVVPPTLGLSARDAARLIGFKFPSGDLLSAAASLFPVPAHRQERAWETTARHRVGSEWVTNAAGKPVKRDVYEYEQSERAVGWREGSYPELVIGPGLLQYRRRDRSSEDRSQLTAHERADKEFQLRAANLRARAAELHAQLHGPMVWALTDGEIQALDGSEVVGRSRGEIVTWSTRSRTNMVKTLLSLDLSHLVAGESLPVMVTLTLPGDWEKVTPDAKTAARKFDNFRRAWAHKWGAPAWIWKREFQRRGAPHWHLWLQPPTADYRAFVTWLSLAWTDALEIEDDEERRRSYLVGTNVSQAEGMKARDPKRLAIYFLKESLGGEGKAYQNRSPQSWAGESVGRFWGFAGLEKSLVQIDLEPADALTVWRILRHIRSARFVTRELRVMRQPRLRRPPFADRYTPKLPDDSGRVNFRKVRRPSKSAGSGGWIAVNDGAVAASQLARFLSGRIADRERMEIRARLGYYFLHPRPAGI